MVILLKTPTNPACFGVACPNHNKCTRYHAVEHSFMPAMATCDDHGTGEHPEFIAVEEPTEEKQ